MRRLLTPTDFEKAWRDHSLEPQQRLATVSTEIEVDNDRTVRYVLSDSSVARDRHSIDQNGWDLSNYLRNPVFLWAHDDGAPPVGTMRDIGLVGGRLMGSVDYVERDVYPFADMIFQMVKRRILNAVSTGWLPLEWRYSTDPARQGGIDFKRQELLEVSQVPVPALASALATARSLGVDTGPMVEWAEKILDGGGFVMVPRAELEAWRRESKMAKGSKKRSAADWKCGAARDLELDTTSDWDGPAASKSIFEACGFDGDSPDVEKARKGFLAYDDANPKLKGSYKLPFAKMADGKMDAVAAGIRAAASRLPDTDIPDSVKETAKEVISHYEDKGSKKEQKMGWGKYGRGLCEVANLAWLLEQLAWLQDYVKWEEEVEQDGSDIAARLAELINNAGLILLDMGKEEVAELLTAIKGNDAEEISDDVVNDAADTPGKRMLVGLMRMAAKTPKKGELQLNLSIPAELTQRLASLESLIRGGKVLSNANYAALQQAMEHHRNMGACIQGVLDAAKPNDEEDPEAVDDPEDEADAQRAAADARRRELDLIELENSAA